MVDLSLLLGVVSILCFLFKRLLRYLRVLQQEDYLPQRFLLWIAGHRAIDSRASGAIIMSLFLYYALPKSYEYVGLLLASVLLLAIALVEEDPRYHGKVTLKLTARAGRIYGIGVFLAICMVSFVFFVLSPNIGRLLLSSLFIVQMPPLCLLMSVIALRPDEARRQARFIAEAKANLSAVDPVVIGITGSYGKTSTKAILGKLLNSALGPTFWPPKSVNTPMGISRELRENLQSFHKYAVIEMGAYARGSITKLCAIAPPRAAIITAVGEMHLERFGSKENILEAKSELAKAVPESGILVCNADNLGALEIARRYKKAKTLLYSLENPEKLAVDAFMHDLTVGPNGTSFVIDWQGKTYAGLTKLYGRPNLSNLLAAFTMAVALGANPEYTVAALQGIDQYENRLEVRRVGSGYQINDAYNSNPVGFAAALEVLRDLPGGKKILMTPGMIELGNLQEAENERLGGLAGSIASEVIIVGETNRESLSRGLKAAGLAAEHIHMAASRTEAFQLLDTIRSEGDVLLIENDLTDLYEEPPRF